MLSKFIRSAPDLHPRDPSTGEPWVGRGPLSTVEFIRVALLQDQSWASGSDAMLSADSIRQALTQAKDGVISLRADDWERLARITRSPTGGSYQGFIVGLLIQCAPHVLAVLRPFESIEEARAASTAQPMAAPNGEPLSSEQA